MNPVIKAQDHRNQWSALFIFIAMSGSRRRAGVCVPGGTRGPGQPTERRVAGDRGGVSPGAPAAARERAGGRWDAAGAGGSRRCGSEGWGSAEQGRLLLHAAGREGLLGLSQHFPAVPHTPLRRKRAMQPGSRTHAHKK